MNKLSWFESIAPDLLCVVVYVLFTVIGFIIMSWALKKKRTFGEIYLVYGTEVNSEGLPSVVIAGVFTNTEAANMVARYTGFKVSPPIEETVLFNKKDMLKLTVPYQVVPEEVFVVGQYRATVREGTVWDIQGVFTDRRLAEDECLAAPATKAKDYFVGPIKLNVMLPSHQTEWPEAKYPVVTPPASE